MAHLRARPVRRLRKPGYPTKLEVSADPDLLRQHLPPAWLSSREIGGALGLLLAAHAAGCSEKAATYVPKGPLRERPAVVAPLFQHGDGQAPGRGAMGCVAVAAPVYLSEEDAVQIIQEELTKIGLNSLQRKMRLPEVIIAGREPFEGYNWVADAPETGLRRVRKPLETDLLDTATGVAVEYVSMDDFDRLGGDDTGKWTRELKEPAQGVAREVGKQGRGVYFATLYDPVKYYRLRSVGANDRWAHSQEAAQTESKRLLRQQVRDFVEWLKGQGVI